MISKKLLPLELIFNSFKTIDATGPAAFATLFEPITKAT